MDPEHHVIAVQCALEREAKLIISEMDDEQTEIILNNRVALGSYRGVSLVVCVGGGMGAANAASAAQFIID